MSARKLKVVLTRRLPDAVETRMRELFDAELNLTDRPMSRDELAAALQRAEVLAPTITDQLDAELIVGAGDQLKMIANFGAGVDHIDIDAAVGRGVIVTNTPGVLTEDTADLGMSLILAVSRRIVEGAAVVEAGRFEGWSPTWMCGRKLWGKRLGIVGMGRIGRAVARRCHYGFGMDVVFFNRSPVTDLDFPARQIPDLNAMLEQADVAVVAVPGGAGTRHLIGAPQMAALGPQGYLVNIARGDVVDEAALIEALTSRRIAGAGLDVYEREPFVPQALLDAPNATLLPHLGTATDDVRTDMGLRALSNLVAFAEGREPGDRVA